jgi:5-methylcytosine-specific restriction endonuclease McrA
MKTNILAAALALSDRELLARIGALAGKEREATAELVAHLAALELRPELYLRDGYGSLFDYCTRALRLSEDAACNRIEAARAGTRFPVILEMLCLGTLTLTAVRKLKGFLTAENHEAVLRKAAHRSKEQLEALIAELAPRPDVPATVRKVSGTMGVLRARPATPGPLGLAFESAPPSGVIGPAETAPTAAGHDGVPSLHEPPPAPLTPRPVVQALAPARYRVTFTIDQDTHDRLRRVQALLRSQVPSGDPAAIFDRALRLLEEVEGRKRGLAVKRPRGPRAARNYENRIRSGTDKADKRSRHIPAAVKRAVWFRDAGQCAFVSDSGRRCSARSFLELHHIHPYALRGPATVGNFALRCRHHNQYEGKLVFGERRAIGPEVEQGAT